MSLPLAPILTQLLIPERADSWLAMDQGESGLNLGSDIRKRLREENQFLLCFESFVGARRYSDCHVDNLCELLTSTARAEVNICSK